MNGQTVKSATLELLESGKPTIQRNINYILGRGSDTNLSGSELVQRREAIAEFEARTQNIGSQDAEVETQQSVGV